MKAGCAEKFVNNSTIMKEAVNAIREGLAVCSKMSVEPKSVKANRPYYLPLFFLVPVLKRIYRNEGLTIMFNGHTKHSPKEMKKMLTDIIKSGKDNKLEMSYLIGLQKCIF